MLIAFFPCELYMKLGDGVQTLLHLTLNFTATTYMDIVSLDFNAKTTEGKL